MPTLNALLARKTLATLRQTAIERMRFFKAGMLEADMVPMMCAEVEYVALNRNGIPTRNLIHEKKLTAALREAVPSFERVARESAAQQEFVAGKNPLFPGAGIADLSPENIAETVTAFQEGLNANAARWNIGGASYDARVRSVNNGMHFNLSLWNKKGETNLFYKPGQFLFSNDPTTDLERHVIDSLIKTHAEGGLIYARTRNLTRGSIQPKAMFITFQI